MQRKYLLTILLLVLSFVFVMNVYAEGETVISGTIESVKGNTITVSESSYSIYMVPILDPSGKKVSINQLAEGKRVDIFFRNNHITSVVVYENISNIIDDENIPK